MHPHKNLPTGTVVQTGSDHVWSGTYYEPGKGSVTGTFKLTLSSPEGANNATYSGTFSSAHDHDLLWDNTVTGQKVSATVSHTKQIVVDAINRLIWKLVEKHQMLFAQGRKRARIGIHAFEHTA